MAADGMGDGNNLLINEVPMFRSMCVMALVVSSLAFSEDAATEKLNIGHRIISAKCHLSDVTVDEENQTLSIKTKIGVRETTRSGFYTLTIDKRTDNPNIMTTEVSFSAHDYQRSYSYHTIGIETAKNPFFRFLKPDAIDWENCTDIKVSVKPKKN